MPQREIRINDKIHGIYANLEDIKRLREESKGHMNKQEIFRKIREHEADNLKIMQELLKKGIDDQEIKHRLQEIPLLMRKDYSKNSTSRGLPSTMNTTRPTQDWRRIIEFVQPEHGLPYEFQLPENRPPMALLNGPRE